VTDACSLLVKALRKERTFMQLTEAVDCNKDCLGNGCTTRHCLHRNLVTLEKADRIKSRLKRVKAEKGVMRWERFYKLK
jgi:hypothetical protein